MLFLIRLTIFNVLIFFILFQIVLSTSWASIYLLTLAQIFPDCFIFLKNHELILKRFRVLFFVFFLFFLWASLCELGHGSFPGTASVWDKPVIIILGLGGFSWFWQGKFQISTLPCKFSPESSRETFDSQVLHGENQLPSHISGWVDLV